MAGWLDTVFGAGAQKDAAAQNAALIGNYMTAGNADLSQAFGPSLSALQSNLTNYQGLQQQFGTGTQMLNNALGLGGPAGTAAAQSAFTTSPGYQAGISQGLEGIARMRNLQGMGNSGNANIDALNYAQNNQNQQWQNWLTNLTGMISPEMAAAGGAATANQNIGGLYQGNAANQIGLLTGGTQGLMAGNNMVAQGEQAGANNLLGLGTSLLKAFANPISSGLSSLGSSLGSALAK